MKRSPVSQIEIQAQTAYVWALESQARVGSYQHLVSTAPWIVLANEREHLRNLLKGRV